MTIRACKCSHDYQDKVYGKGQRVHTPTNRGHRCTVCGSDVVEGAKRK